MGCKGEGGGGGGLRTPSWRRVWRGCGRGGQKEAAKMERRESGAELKENVDEKTFV